MNYSTLFRKQILIKESSLNLSHGHKIVLMGSCFTSNISSFLSRYGFSSCYPFGTLYNPITIANNLERVLSLDRFKETDFVENDGVFYSWNHSGAYCDSSLEGLIKEINGEIFQLNSTVKESSTLIITLGTSIIYEHHSYGLVGNCHKIPSTNFNKRMLLPNEMLKCWRKLLCSLKDKNIIFTVSPVRHWSDGAVDNTRSKSQLHLLIAELESEFNNVSYFPSYELMMDELRDYRFYKRDMLHPSNEAVEFIWNKFVDFCFGDSTKSTLLKVDAIRNALSHKPFNPKSKNHQSFLLKSLDKIQVVQSETPHYSWDKEIELIKVQLID